MPSKKGSKKLVFKQSLLGTYQKNKKLKTNMEEKIAEQEMNLTEQRKVIQKQEDSIDLQNQIILDNKDSLEKLNIDIDNQRRKISHKRRALKALQIESESLPKRIRSNPTAFSITEATSKERKDKPTTSAIRKKAKNTRTTETLDACRIIHGGSESCEEPALIGLVQTLTCKFKANEIVPKIMNAKPAVTKRIKQNIISEWSNGFARSEQNKLRSLNVYYCHDVMGKRKYISTRRANTGNLLSGSNIPNYIPYKELSSIIRNLDIGTVTNANELVPDSVIKIDGAYREPAEYIMRLALFYLTVDKNRKDKLLKFENLKKIESTNVVFVMALGGDAAPISGTSILVSFLNCSERVASSFENFLLFGANVEEDAEAVKVYFKKLIADIKYLESKQFEVKDTKVEFQLGELPNDLKMLAFLAGELTNSAKYFITFADVSQDDCNDITKSFGLSAHNDWKPWSYEKRLEHVSEVNKKKHKNPKACRATITQYIASLKSRQEFVPIVETYVDKAKAEPLHLKNNVVKEQFMKLLKICIAKTNLKGVKSFSEVDVKSLFAMFTEFVRKEMNCNFLSKKVKRWFNDNGGKIVFKDFSFRFRGKESFNFLQNFPMLISMVFQKVKAEDVKMRLVEIHFQCILIRLMVSYCARITQFKNEDLQEMERVGKLLFKVSCLFDNLSPSLWTLCCVTPVHAKLCFQNYHFGLGCNTMEGREQKHQRIAKYAENTTFQNRWPMIFRHEYVHLVHLRENGFDQIKYNKRSRSYVPKNSPETCQNCHMPFLPSSKCCVLCDSKLYSKVQEIIKIK